MKVIHTLSGGIMGHGSEDFAGSILAGDSNVKLGISISSRNVGGRAAPNTELQMHK